MDNNSFVIMSDGELMHWKYVKREKRGGEWKYYYKDDLPKGNAKTLKSEYQKRNAARQSYEKQAQSAQIRERNAAIKSGDEERRWAVSDRGSNNKDRAMDLRKNVNLTKIAYNKTAAGKVDKAATAVKDKISNAKKALKDVSGYDEKEKAQSTKKSADLAKKQAEYYDDEMRILKNKRAEKFGNTQGEKGFRQLIDDTIRYRYEDAAEAESKAKEAAKDFAKTPLGLLEKAKDFVDSSEESREYGSARVELERARENFNKKGREYTEVKNKIESGEYFDKDRGNYSILEPYEKEYLKAKREYKNAAERTRKAEKEYKATPQYKTAKASERIKNGTKKVSEWFKTHKL